ncbi:MAG: hypothetical protein J6K46_06750 [Sutterella sp.]|nr:hypothetical protein [Sutterella sp.]
MTLKKDDKRRLKGVQHVEQGPRFQTRSGLIKAFERSLIVSVSWYHLNRRQSGFGPGASLPHNSPPAFPAISHRSSWGLGQTSNILPLLILQNEVMLI